MTVTNISIINQSLALLRADSIAALSDTSNEGVTANLFYTTFVNDVLTRYPWSFATKKAALVATTAPLNEYTYAHTVPTECLRVWAVWPDDTVGIDPITEYDIQSGGASAGSVILSDYSSLWADYTFYKSEAYWPHYFSTFVIKAFAALVAMPITDKPELAEYWTREAWGPPQDNYLGGAFGVACRLDAQQKPGETIVSSPLVDARFS